MTIVLLIIVLIFARVMLGLYIHEAVSNGAVNTKNATFISLSDVKSLIEEHIEYGVLEDNSPVVADLKDNKLVVYTLTGQYIFGKEIHTQTLNDSYEDDEMGEDEDDENSGSRIFVMDKYYQYLYYRFYLERVKNSLFQAGKLPKGERAILNIILKGVFTW